MRNPQKGHMFALHITCIFWDEWVVWVNITSQNGGCIAFWEQMLVWYSSYEIFRDIAVAVIQNIEITGIA